MESTILQLGPLRDGFFARNLQRTRLNKKGEDAWALSIAEDVERDEHATAMAKEWLKCALSSDQRNFYNFVPPLVDNTYKLFVRYFWYIHVEDSNKANNLLREARQEWGMEPKYLYSRYHGHGEEVGGGQASGSEVLMIPPSPPPFWVGGKTKPNKFSRRKQNESKPTPSTIKKRQGAARKSGKKKRILSGKKRLTNTGKKENLVAIPDEGVRRVTEVTSDKRGISRSDKRATRSQRLKARKGTRNVDKVQRVSATSRKNRLLPSRRKRCQVVNAINGRRWKKTRAMRRSIQERRSSAPNEIPVYSFDNAAENITEFEEETLGEDPSTVYVGPEKEPEAPVFPKQSLPVRPPIWAKSRQEVCESLDSFRSFQGGVYQIHDLAKGYLLGGYSSSRDIFHHGGRLIISHGGGKAESLHSRNRHLEVRGPGDQLEDDRSVRALLNTYESRRPLMLLADDNYKLFPFDLTADGYTYVVLGIYWITHAWAELQQVNEDGVVRYKFAFQWCEVQGNPWWSQDTVHVPAITPGESTQIPVPQGHSTALSQVGQANPQLLQPGIATHRCPSCKAGSPLVYEGTPMCLQPGCPLFFKVDPSTVVAGNSPRSSLSYSAELLRLQPTNHVPVNVASFFPSSAIDLAAEQLPSDTIPRVFAKGMHCQDCGRLSTRFKWENYECSHCHRIYEAPRFRVNHKVFWVQGEPKFFQHRIAEDSGIEVKGPQFTDKAHIHIQTFVLPHNRGRLHLIPGHLSINREANTIFEQYQEQAATGKIQFRRWPLRSHKCRGQLLSNYFSQNTGAPYQYIGGTERTTPMEEAAQGVSRALRLIQCRIKATLGKHIDFNEVLSAAYMERQRMTFHSDSERGLGPVVASLSLGSVAEMHFRLHSKYDISEGHRKIAMTLLLKHGDVLVMEGAGVHEYYEHAVVPKAFRVAATARYISPENYAT